MLLAEGPRGKKLTWAETEPLVAANEIVLVDARDPISYQTEHIPGAISLPETSSEADLASFAAKYPRDTALVIYCNSSKCPMGRELAKTLRSKKWGYSNIREMPGGFAEYRATVQHR
jgi:rhodanese-related sulfurtransferase